MKGKYARGANLIVNTDGSHEKVPSHAIDSTVPGPGTYSASHRQIFSSLSAKFGTEVRPSLG